MHDTVVLDGELSLVLTESAECSLLVPEPGESGIMTVVRESEFPAYTGPTEVTPSQETQILSTQDTSVMSDIIINPIPSNYGLITWNGSALTVS